MKFLNLALAAAIACSIATIPVSASGYGQIDQPKKSQLQGPSVFYYAHNTNNDMESNALITQKNSKKKDAKG